MKRFYKSVARGAAGAAFTVLLDGRPVKTPAGAVLELGSAPLAEAIAAEWAGQGDEIDRRAMPLTGLANTAIDHVRPDPQAVIARLETYAGHDLTCYRSAEPAELVRREATAWDPPLLWAKTRYGLDLRITDGIGSIAQPPESVVRLRAHLADREAFFLTGLANAAGLLQSVVLALALADGRLSSAEAHAAAHVDEDFQAEKWGWDAEASDRLKNMRAELDATARFLTLAKG